MVQGPKQCTLSSRLLLVKGVLDLGSLRDEEVPTGHVPLPGPPPLPSTFADAVLLPPKPSHPHRVLSVSHSSFRASLRSLVLREAFLAMLMDAGVLLSLPWPWHPSLLWLSALSATAGVHVLYASPDFSAPGQGTCLPKSSRWGTHKNLLSKCDK